MTRHSFIVLNRASGASTADWLSRTHVVTTKHFTLCWWWIATYKKTPVSPHPDQNRERTIKCKMVDCTAIKELLIPKTLNKLTYVLVVVWFVVGATLCVAFSEIEISESRYDIQCVAGKNPDIAFIRGKCSDQYRIENHKLGFPPYLFVIVNVLLILIVPVFYSQIVKSTVDELERNPQDAQLQQRKNSFHRIPLSTHY